MAHDHAEHVRASEEYAAAHVNHEGLHSYLMILLFMLLIASQVGLHYWKRKYYRSFQTVTLFGLWLIPLAVCIFLGFWRFIFFWTTFTISTGYLLWKASQSTLEKDLPRKIYAWFFFLWRVSYATSIIGYVLLMMELFGVSRFLANNVWSTAGEYIGVSGLNLIFYGLYFGVLSRDCAEVCTDRVASKMGYTGKNLPAKAISERSCGICGEEFETRFAEVQLDCKHRFHEWCIRGWTIIGKKDTCPYCSEKVQLNRVFSNPWEKQGIVFGQLLDSIRYLVVWNPIILTTVNLMIYFIDPGA